MTTLRGLLERVVQILDESDVPFMIAGSFASTAHGLARTTHDVDVVIDPTPEAFDALLDRLSSDIYYVDLDTARDAMRRRSMFNVIDQVSGWKVDFIVRKNRPFSNAEFARRMKLTLVDVPVFVASPEDTIVAKLEWSHQSGGSERQRRDIAGIIATMGEQLDHAYVEHWVRELALADEWATAQTMTG